MKLIRKSRKNKGFTLIELIVVVSIILILSGFLVPKVLGYQDKAKKAKVVNTARQIFDTSMESYTEEEGKLDKSKLYNSILQVTDVISDDTKVKVVDDTATVTLISDSKTYDVIISPKTNAFSVKQYADASATSGSIDIYSNK